MNIYVSNLSFNVQDEDLRAFFTEYGDVTSAKVITDKFTGKSRGFGFVEMPDNEAGQKAIAELDNGIVEGRTIRVMEARPKEARPERTGGGGFGGGNRGGGGFGGGNSGGGYNKPRY
ncbi:MAG: RNA-binding protein [Chitinophagaceae bacterium]|nr:MAG: RNA-binding protein [Chitinophagaceae bacterium]